MGLSPRDPDLLDTMVGAIDPWDSSMEERLQLAGVEMPPDSLRGVIVDGEGSATLGAAPRNALFMDCKNVDPLLIKI
jgi:hypothetical protein